MVRASGLIFTPIANARTMEALDMHFEPAMIISARKLDKLGIDIRSMREPLKRSIQRVIIPSIRKNFEAEGRNPKWPRLADSTIKARGSSHPILVRSGRLKRTMGYLNIWTIDREKAFIADLPESVWYGKVHQSGATFSVRGGGFSLASAEHQRVMAALGRSSSGGTAGGTGTIPARPFVVLRKQDEREIQKVFNEWLGERIAAAGLNSRRTVGI